jgi:hypothetical protein
MYLGSAIVRENSLRTHKAPQLRLAFALCARSKSGLVLVLCRPVLLRLRRAPPFFGSCDCTSETTAEEVNATEFIDDTARCFVVRKLFSAKHFPIACVSHQSQCGVRKTTMPDHSYILFNKSPLQLRSIGARGGRAYGRNLRARRARIAVMPTPAQAIPLRAAPQPTAAEAIALLNAQFPWLRSAEKRLSSKLQNPRRAHPDQVS